MAHRDLLRVVNVRTVVSGALALRGQGKRDRLNPHDSTKAHALLTKTAIVHAELFLLLTQLGGPEVCLAPPHCMTEGQHVRNGNIVVSYSHTEHIAGMSHDSHMITVSQAWDLSSRTPCQHSFRALRGRDGRCLPWVFLKWS